MEDSLHMSPAEQTAQLERSLLEAENALMELYCSLGKSLMDAVESEERKIHRLADEIIHLRSRLSDARSEIVCASCMTRNPPESRFCRFCGAFLPADAPASPTPPEKG